MTAVQKTLVIVLACIAVVLGLTINKVLNAPGGDRTAERLDAGIVLLQSPREMPAVELINHDGQSQALNQLKGQWRLVFFGYTFCPDICPTTLADLRQIKTQLPENIAKQLQVVMITVDPKRDTSSQLKQYLGYFDQSMLGLTGSPEAIQQAATAMGVPFIPVANDAAENYLVDHGANLAIIAPDGRQQGFIRAPLRKDKLVLELPNLIQP